MRTLNFLRRAAFAAWLFLLTLVVATVVAGHGVPLLGDRLVIISGPSMSPAIPVGSLVLEQRVNTTTLRPGDVVTFGLPNGTVVTHRIVRLSAIDGILHMETKGDANANPDPVLLPVSRISGIVRASLPVAGFVFAYLTLPTGMVSVVSMLVCLLLCIWLLEDWLRELDQRPNPGAAPSPVPDGLAA